MSEFDIIKKLYDKELEEKCIASLMVDLKNYYDFPLFENVFYIDANRRIFKTMLNMIKDKEIFDLAILIGRLKDSGELEKCGGESNIYRIISTEYSSLYYESYARRLYEIYLRRETYFGATELVKRILNGEKVIEAINKFSTNINNKLLSSESIPISSILDNVYDKIMERFSNPREFSGVPYRMAELDKYTKGLHPDEGEFVLIGGEPGIGKTVFAVQMAVNLAYYNNLPGIFYSLEMTAEKLIERMVSYLSGISLEKIDLGSKEEGDVEKIVNAFEILHKIPLYIVENTRMNIHEIRADLNRRLLDGVKFFVIDYLQCVRGFEDVVSNKPEREAMLSREIRDICREFRVGGIVLSSVLKEAMDGNLLTKKSLRGSGEITHDGDVILLISKHQPENGTPKNNDMRTIIIDKNRNRKGGVVFDMFFGRNGIMVFQDIEKRNLLLNGYLNRKDLY